MIYQIMSSEGVIELVLAKGSFLLCCLVLCPLLVVMAWEWEDAGRPILLQAFVVICLYCTQSGLAAGSQAGFSYLHVISTPVTWTNLMGIAKLVTLHSGWEHYWSSYTSSAVDHNILLQLLKHWFGVSGLALSWFASYLHHHAQSICLNQHTSVPTAWTAVYHKVLW